MKRSIKQFISEADADAVQPSILREGGLLLANAETLPFKTIETLSRQPIVVFAPHPDDETLGCGGAIALLCRGGCEIKVLVMSDGTLSHPSSQKFPPRVLQSIRERETIDALALLGVRENAISFLRLKDGSVPSLSSPSFGVAKAQCCEYLKTARPKTAFLPWRLDPHADHRATWQLIQSAIAELKMAVRCIEYPVWDWDAEQQRHSTGANSVLGWRLNVEEVLDRKCQAIATYRSQLGQVVDDDPDGFCLTPELLVNFTRPWEVYFEETPNRCPTHNPHRPQNP
jgi:LmbE family N-acetylglucosaminyl deacetylase